MGPDDSPRRCVASPIAGISATSGSEESGSEEQIESKQGALSTESMISSLLDVYNCDGVFLKGTLGRKFCTKANDCDWHSITLKQATEIFILSIDFWYLKMGTCTM